ncbi:hypothetical protein CP8484711_1666A, partial [Chlamydia psittaci 84-8471/1]
MFREYLSNQQFVPY